MKSKTILLSGASPALVLALVCGSPASAQSTDRSVRVENNAVGSARSNLLGTPLKSSDLIGAKIENAAGKKIGTVDDLAVDLQTGRIVHVIVSAGGFMNMGQRHYALPPAMVSVVAPGKALRSDVTMERLKSAPAFETARWTAYYGSDRARESSRYFGDESGFESDSIRSGQAGTATGTSGSRTVEKATKLTGLAVKNLQDEKIGSVDNLMVDLSSGRVVAVIVSSGGFLGMGDALSVIPPTALRHTAERDGLRLDTTKDALAKAPSFKTGAWPDFGRPEYTAGVYSAYGMEPYFNATAGSYASTPEHASMNSRHRDDSQAPMTSSSGKAARNSRDLDETRTSTAASSDYAVGNSRDRDENRTSTAAAPDNSARNSRDRDSRTLTAGDQSNSEGDIAITQRIRREVTAADGLSVNAKNVKIITVDGRVTLRGPVKTPEEKIRVVEIATRIARVENVDDQLEVTEG